MQTKYTHIYILTLSHKVWYRLCQQWWGKENKKKEEANWKMGDMPSMNAKKEWVDSVWKKKKKNLWIIILFYAHNDSIELEEKEKIIKKTTKCITMVHFIHYNSISSLFSVNWLQNQVQPTIQPRIQARICVRLRVWTGKRANKCGSERESERKRKRGWDRA